MYLIVNAMKNLLRNKGRNILIAAVTLAIVISTVVTLTINNAAAKIIEDTRLDIGSKVTIEQDLMKLRQSGEGAGGRVYIGIEDYLMYAESDYLQHAIFNAEIPMYPSDFNFYAVDDADKGANTFEKDDGTTAYMPTTLLRGTTDPDSMAYFGKERSIVEGRIFANLNECIISSDLAELNGLSVGDKLDVESVFGKTEVVKYELAIVGIYSDETEPYGSFNWGSMPYINKRNEIITSYDTVMAQNFITDEGLDFKAEYYLRDPDDLSKFEAEVRAKGLTDAYDVSINQAAYDKVTGPLAGMKGVSMTYMVTILVLGAIALILISFLAIRERKYEVGVLRAMGLEKVKIAFGILTEALMIAMVCLAIGLGAGSAVAQPVADGILGGKVAAAEKDASQAGNKFISAGGKTQVNGGANDYKAISEIQVELGKDTIVQLIVITLALAALSGAIGIVAITRYEPLRMLRERN